MSHHNPYILKGGQRYRMIAIENARIITPFDEFIGNIIFDERIVGLGPKIKIPSESEVIEGDGLIVTPGFIEIHSHGIGGFPKGIPTEEDFKKMAEEYAKHGVTSFLFTTITSPQDALIKIAENAKKAFQKRRSYKGAEFMGLHLEGPWISKEKPGAQPEDYIRPPNIKEFEEIRSVFPEGIRIVSIAPEEPDAIDFIKFVVKHQILVAMGHTNATYEQALEGIRAGISHAIHAFNAMSGFHHRKPGVIGAVLDTDITTEVILDGIHVHPASARILIKAKGPNRVALVTDSIPMAGLPDGEYEFMEIPLTVKNGKCVISGTDILAGSVLTLDKAIKNARKFFFRPLREIIQMVTATPATILGVISERGELSPGKIADIVILDSELNVRSVFVRGRKIL